MPRPRTPSATVNGDEADRSGSSGYTRRGVLATGIVGAATLGVPGLADAHRATNRHPPMRPNFLLLVCDHLSPRVMGCYGDTDSATPAIDALARRGVCFDRAYTTVPLCQPARASFWTGLHPHQSGVQSNGSPNAYPHRHRYLDEPVPADVPTLGSLFRDAGYTTAHFGKTHDRGALRGFDCAPEGELPVEGDPRYVLNHDTFRDRFTTDRCERFLREHGHRPFFAVADLNNPHNICGWVGAHAGTPTFADTTEPLPELPPNFEVDDWGRRPEPVRYLCCSNNRQQQAAHWDSTACRHYLAAFRYYSRLVDREVARLLAALAQRPDADRTYVILMSDHGDGLASHRLVTKQVAFYEQLMRVPFVVAGPGIDAQRKPIDTPLVSLLDLLPTCADLAGIPIPDGKPGLSLKPWLRGETQTDWRQYVVGEWLTEWGHTINPGRMLRGERFKYACYRGGRHGELQEELYDLDADPWETRTLHTDPVHTATLSRCREELAAHCAATDDSWTRAPVVVRPGSRRHAPGFLNHTGLSEPQRHANASAPRT